LTGAENRLALTLFRSVGLLGRDDLLWRPGRASGINNKVVETPDAQLLKPMVLTNGTYLFLATKQAAISINYGI